MFQDCLAGGVGRGLACEIDGAGRDNLVGLGIDLNTKHPMYWGVYVRIVCPCSAYAYTQAKQNR